MKRIAPWQVYPVMASLCLLLSCSGEYADKSAVAADSVAVAYDSSMPTPLEKEHDLLIRKGYMDIKVKDMRSSSERIFAQVRKLNGEIYNSRWTTEENHVLSKKQVTDTTVQVTNLIQRHSITIKVPRPNLDSLMELITREGEIIVLKELTTTNVGLDYLANDLKNKNTLQLQDSYEEQRDKRSHKLEDLTMASSFEQGRLDDLIDKQVQNLKWKKDSEMATLEVSLLQEKQLVVASHYTPDPDSFESPYYLLVWDALRDGILFCSSLLLFLIRIWPIYLIAFVGFKLYQFGHKHKFFETKTPKS